MYTHCALLFYLTLTKREDVFKIKGIARAMRQDLSRRTLHLAESERRAVTQTGLLLHRFPSAYPTQTHLAWAANRSCESLRISLLASCAASSRPPPRYLQEASASARLIERRMYRRKALTANLHVTQAQMNPVQPPGAKGTEHPKCCCHQSKRKKKKHTHSSENLELLERV